MLTGGTRPDARHGLIAAPANPNPPTIGLARDLGSITLGKAADLVVLNSDPLQDIHNTRDILYVMKAGRLYTGDTLDEIWPEARPYGVRPWAGEAVRGSIQ